MLAIQRQFIRDAAGVAIGVILPIEEFFLVRGILERENPPSTDEKLQLMEQAAGDPLFAMDLAETMAAFSSVDSEWWEPAA